MRPFKPLSDVGCGRRPLSSYGNHESGGVELFDQAFSSERATKPPLSNSLYSYRSGDSFLSHYGYHPFPEHHETHSRERGFCRGAGRRRLDSGNNEERKDEMGKPLASLKPGFFFSADSSKRWQEGVIRHFLSLDALQHTSREIREAGEQIAQTARK